MVEGKNVDVVLKNPYVWKEMATGSVDVFVSGQAFEHIEYFWVTMLEISRVLKPGALCCIIAPSGGYEHRYPVDCWRFYPDGFSSLARFAQLDVLDVYTQWEPKGYEVDDSDNWQDSVLICKKPTFPLCLKLKSALKNYLLHSALKWSVKW
jgi:SAM-dependent methyltransferase